MNAKKLLKENLNHRVLEEKIIKTLHAAKLSKKEIAQKLGFSERTIFRKFKQYKISA